MNKEREIEEIAKLFCRSPIKCCDCKDGSGENNYKVFCPHIRLARQYADAGYGNVKQYQDEIDRLETELAHREEDLVHADEKVFYRKMAVKLEEDKIKKQAVKEFAKRIKMEFYYEFEELIPSIMANKIDDLITELYGADE